MRADSHGGVRLVNSVLDLSLTSAHGLRYPQESNNCEATMKRSTTRAQERAKRKAAREAGQKRPGGASNYAKKSKFLNAHGGFGFEYPDRPWRSA